MYIRNHALTEVCQKSRPHRGMSEITPSQRYVRNHALRGMLEITPSHRYVRDHAPTEVCQNSRPHRGISEITPSQRFVRKHAVTLTFWSHNCDDIVNVDVIIFVVISPGFA